MLVVAARESDRDDFTGKQAMNIINQKRRDPAHGILTRPDGPDEAIETAMTKHLTQVVLKPGWGSMVYFISTAIKRSEGATRMSLHPVLRDNRMDFAQGMGLTCAVLNSTVKKGSNERFSIIQQWKDNQPDDLLYWSSYKSLVLVGRENSTKESLSSVSFSSLKL